MEATTYFRPSQSRMDDLIVNAEVAKAKPVNSAAAPSGWSLVWRDRKLAANLTEDWDWSH